MTSHVHVHLTRALPAPHLLRYEKNWEEVRVLGQGSFGRAILLRSRTPDEHTGAIDEAVAKQTWAGHLSTRQLVRLEREVSALISLKDAAHVIRYRTCFLKVCAACPPPCP